jgi:DNA-binding protein YbaB
VSVLAYTYDAMRAAGRSPDRSVTITVGGRGGVDVELAADVMRTHDEVSLGRQVAAAARVALAAFQREQKRAIDDAVAQARAAW